MTPNSARDFLFRFISVALVCTGFLQTSAAGMIGTGYMIEGEAREASLARLEVLLARNDVARQLEAFGVEQSMILERLHGMSNAELLALEGHVDERIAGGDALAVIGTVFLVLLILELVGVTDVFKSL